LLFLGVKQLYWEVFENPELWKTERTNPEIIAFSPDGKTIELRDERYDGKMESAYFDTNSGKNVGSRSDDDWIVFDLSSDSRLCRNNRASSGALSCEASVRRDGITVTFQPGQYLGDDYTLKVEVPGAKTKTYKAGYEQVIFMQITPVTHRLVMWWHPYTLKVWELPEPD